MILTTAEKRQENQSPPELVKGWARKKDRNG